MAAPAVNAPLVVAGRTLHGDLAYPDVGTIMEVEGLQHQTDRHHYLNYLERYAAFRRAGLQCVQLTRESLRTPRRTVEQVHRALTEFGYDGPAPAFDERSPSSATTVRRPRSTSGGTCSGRGRRTRPAHVVMALQGGESGTFFDPRNVPDSPAPARAPGWR
ncbi:hypothetical protein [Nocardioides sp. R-C-SC26]|uniref:hypothetical protein n=1 Tax=Nocardioides sp. R-C-SC26 TaxID=2870414 RepID=UPI001E5DE0FA|nr:hypothetical protein [Nocardioides sp. R-C-SC26]